MSPDRGVSGTRRPALVVSCEHGGNRLPAGFPRPATLLEALPTHRGWDPGALGLARGIASRLDAPLRYSTISRLVVELNRSETHPDLFSPWTRTLPPWKRRTLVTRYHTAYRTRVQRAIEDAREGGTRAVVHLSVHSFTPVWEEVERAADIGILFDPDYRFERRIAESWADALVRAEPTLRIRLNEPYEGRTDGLTRTLREHFRVSGGAEYAGLELELNQGMLDTGVRFPRTLTALVTTTLNETLHTDLQEDER